jgi:GNAT superfamily N-acetyltransferase
VYAFEDVGLQVLEVPDLGALDADPGGGDDRPHVVRIASDEPDWRAVGSRDVVVRPTWVHWACPAQDATVDALARQSSQQRWRTRKAVRLLRTMTTGVSEPVDLAALREWTELYDRQVRTMARGRNFFSMARKDVLTSPHALVVWRDRGKLAGGCVLGFRPDLDSVIMRFAAVDPEYRDANLPRGMYALVAEIAAERGYRWLTLGNDVNFYGTLVRPGLCVFKLRIGFRPVPADLFGVMSCRTVVERVTDLRGLHAPVLLFEYAGSRPPTASVEDFADGEQAMRLVSISGAGSDAEAGILRSLPAHRSLVLDRPWQGGYLKPAFPKMPSAPGRAGWGTKCMFRSESGCFVSEEEIRGGHP